MYFLALASDYDGTIARFGVVDDETCNALQRLKASGRKLLLVTGREIASLKHAFPRLDVFDMVVAENGAVLLDPATGNETVLAARPPAGFIEKLVARRVEPMSVGHCIVASWEPNQAAILESIKECGAELSIVFNKGAVMVLPPGINKASGLQAALKQLDISAHNVVGVGDAENDHAFLSLCGCAAAVANALDSIRDDASVRLEHDHGRGVVDLIGKIMHAETSLIDPDRLGLPIGVDRGGVPVHLMPRTNVLVIGDSGCGKSRFAKMLTERMVEKNLEFAVIDPEGDYHGLEHAIPVAEGLSIPRTDEALSLLREAGLSVVVNTVSLCLADRQRFIAEIVKPISDLQARTGRPHWVIVDEAHQVFPAAHSASVELPNCLPAMIFVTVSPELLSSDVLSRIDAVIGLGRTAPERLAGLLDRLGMPRVPMHGELGADDALLWRRGKHGVTAFEVQGPRQFHRRHTGKYAVGDVGEWHSFYFRPNGDMPSLRARNACDFVDVSRRVDDRTWEQHLRAHDYSRWFRDVIRDPDIADSMLGIESDLALDASQSRARIRGLVLSRYAAPVT